MDNKKWHLIETLLLHLLYAIECGLKTVKTTWSLGPCLLFWIAALLVVTITPAQLIALSLQDVVFITKSIVYFAMALAFAKAFFQYLDNDYRSQRLHALKQFFLEWEEPKIFKNK